MLTKAHMVGAPVNLRGNRGPNCPKTKAGKGRRQTELDLTWERWAPIRRQFIIFLPYLTWPMAKNSKREYPQKLLARRLVFTACRCHSEAPMTATGAFFAFASRPGSDRFSCSRKTCGTARRPPHETACFGGVRCIRVSYGAFISLQQTCLRVSAACISKACICSIKYTYVYVYTYTYIYIYTYLSSKKMYKPQVVCPTAGGPAFRPWRNPQPSQNPAKPLQNPRGPQNLACS